MKPTPIQTEDATRGHEVRDVDERKLFAFTVGFLICAVLIQLVVGWIFFVLKKDHPQSFAAEVPVATPRAEWPKPALQFSPSDEFDQFRANEEKVLHSYGWVDRSSGVVRIPVQRAIDLLLQENAAMQTNVPTKGKSE